MISHVEQNRRTRFREGLALLLLAAAAVLFQRSATAAWAEATTADSTRYAISPIGLASTPASAPAAECRWWPRLGDPALCAMAPDGAEAHISLRRAYPLTVVAMWIAVLALFLNALRLPRRAPSVRIAIAAAAPALATVALWTVASSSSQALTVLIGLPVRPLMPGFVVIVGATALSTAAVVLLASGITSAGTRHQASGP